MELKDIAIAQLRAAARLYNESNYVCAITLAGAAEEILGQMARKRIGFNQFDGAIAYHKSTMRFFNEPLPSDKEAKTWVNKLKNAMKHNDSGENSWLDPKFFEDEAAALIVRATKNYIMCYEEPPRDRIIRSLFLQLTL